MMIVGILVLKSVAFWPAMHDILPSLKLRNVSKLHQGLALALLLTSQVIRIVDVRLLNRIRKRHHQHHLQNHSGYDPFTLISFKQLADSTLPSTSPQSVKVFANVLMIMDIHAHLAHTEIIGLLGGTFDAATKTLDITDVIPCRSDSTDIQCEMDPISELHARTTLAAKNLVVVGWYHSHPTFEPKPSVRDLENQGAYQVFDLGLQA